MESVAGTQTAGSAKTSQRFSRYIVWIGGLVLTTRLFFAKHPALIRSLLLLTALYAALVSAPQPPTNLGFSLDESWRLGLNLAHARHLVAGRDIIFTYGPLGYLAAPLPMSGAPAAAFAYHVGLYLLWVFALFRIATTIPSKVVAFWTIAVLCSGVVLDLFSRENRLETTLMAVALIPLARQAQWRYAELAAVAFLAALAAMVKLNTGIEGAGIFLAVLAVVVCRDWPLSRTVRRQASGALVSLPLCVFLLYFLSTGSLNIWPYLRTGWEIIAGYSEMGVPGPLWEAALFLSLSALIFIGFPLVALNMRSVWAGYVPAAFATYLQLKHALVRQDSGHAAPFLGWLAICLLFLLVCTEAARDRRLIVMLQLFAMVMGYAIVVQDYGPWFQNAVAARLELQSAYSNFAAFVHWPATWKELGAREAEVRTRSQLGETFASSVGQNTVTDIGYNLHAIAAHKWNWHPMPVLQLYSAYTPTLDALNAAYLESTSAADFALVDFSDIDSRHPLLSEPLSWRALFDRYDIEIPGGDFALMQRRAKPRFEKPVLLSSVVARWGQNVAVPQTKGWLLMSPHITRTLSGRIKSLFLRTSPVFLDTTPASGKTSRWRTIAPNMRAGVLVHPFLESIDDAALFTSGVASPQNDLRVIRFHTDDPSQYSGAIEIQWLRLPAEAPGGAGGVLSTGALAATKLFDQFGVDGLRDLPPLGQVIFANPNSRFALPRDQIKQVRFQYGILDGALQASPRLDGVIFRVLLKHSTGREDVLWMSTLTPVSRPEDRGVKEAEIVVNTSSADQLIFETLAVKNPLGDWAFWRSVVVQK